MKFKEFSGAPFSYFETYSEQTFLKVYHSLLDESDFLQNISFRKNASASGFISFTYKEILNIVDSMTQQMDVEVIKINEPIPIIFSNPFDLILSVLTIWRLNTIPVPLNFHLLKNDLLHQINFLDADKIICGTEHAKNFLSLNRILFTNSDLSIKSSTTDLKSESTAVMLFTSGTSGKPKAVPLTFDNLFGAFKAGNSIFNYSETDSWYLNLPLYHIGGFSILTRTFFAG